MNKKQTPKNWRYRYSVALIWVYFTVLYGWLLAYWLIGDAWPHLGLLHNFAFYLFLPLPAAALVAVLARQRPLLIGSGVGALVFLGFWGGLFLPQMQTAAAVSSGESLRVLTYNLLGVHGLSEPALATIQAADADLVFLQELAPQQAAVIQAELISSYPYQVLDARPGVTGMGVISRFPITLLPEKLPLEWVGVPQILLMDWRGQPVTLVNFHAFAYGDYTSARALDVNLRYREAQTQALADFAARTAGPLIIAGDANTTDLSSAYRKLISSGLQDAWRQAGFGLGGTFPGKSELAQVRAYQYGSQLPEWVVRIDYILHSPQWTTRTAQVAPYDGVSDHRGVIAELNLVSP